MNACIYLQAPPLEKDSGVSSQPLLITISNTASAHLVVGGINCKITSPLDKGLDRNKIHEGKTLYGVSCLWIELMNALDNVVLKVKCSNPLILGFDMAFVWGTVENLCQIF